MPTTHSVLALMPVLVGNSVFVTAPHGNGGALFELLPPVERDGPVGAKELWWTRLDSLQGCVAHTGGKLFGSYYSKGKGLAALEAATGQVLYENLQLAKGALLVADDRLYLLMISSSLDVILHLARHSDGVRRVVSISEITGTGRRRHQPSGYFSLSPQGHCR